MNPKDKLLTKAEAADYLRVTQRTINRYKEKGLITARRVGGKLLFKESELMNSVKSASNG